MYPRVMLNGLPWVLHTGALGRGLPKHFLRSLGNYCHVLILVYRCEIL